MKSETLERICIFLVLAAMWAGVRWLRGDFEPPRLVPQPRLEFNFRDRPHQIPVPIRLPEIGESK